MKKEKIIKYVAVLIVVIIIAISIFIIIKFKKLVSIKWNLLQNEGFCILAIKHGVAIFAT